MEFTTPPHVCVAHKALAAAMANAAASNLGKKTMNKPELEANKPKAETGDCSTRLLARIETMTNQDIQLLCGDLSRQELRTARALLDWVAREMRANHD
jgi:hypothetical protein